MDCPKCGMEMRRVGLAQAAGAKVFTTMECPGCHYRAEQQPEL